MLWEIHQLVHTQVANINSPDSWEKQTRVFHLRIFVFPFQATRWHITPASQLLLLRLGNMGTPL